MEKRWLSAVGAGTSLGDHPSHSTRRRPLVRLSRGLLSSVGGFCLLSSVLGLLPSPAFAQYDYSLDYQTNTINVVSNWAGNGTYVVGSNTYLNALVINSGGALSNGTGYIGYETAGSNNVALISGTGSVWNNQFTLTIGHSGAVSRLIITNAGVVVNVTGVMGLYSNSHDNVVLVSDSGSAWSNFSTLFVGSRGAGNQLTVTNGGTLVSWGGILGYFDSGSNNAVAVAGNGAKWEDMRNLIVGYESDTNTLTIGTGGSVIASNAYVGYLAGADGNRINMTGGSLYVTNALGRSVLDIRRGTLTASASSLITADNLLIGSAGFVTTTVTRITIAGATTNSGTLTMLNSYASFGGPVVNHGAWITDPTTNIFNGDLLVTSSGYISAGAGDVYEFKSNFVNQSTQNTSYDTLNTTPGNSGAPGTKFIFDGEGAGGTTLTQQFFVAGLLLTGGFVGTPDPLTTGIQTVTTFSAVSGFVNNFALDRLEIGNAGTNSILRLTDSFFGDGQTAALFVNDLWLLGDSHLILSNNVRLYFVNSNNWSLADVTLLGDAEIHQLKPLITQPPLVVPEPSILLLWLAGAGTLYAARRRSSGVSVDSTSLG
ncbi:MAG: hypothetical protein PCFJNLEI_03094 [Verrucomicrobiae bacterium]|nr:hypothetical protein [Verrucomicrobiae bacterium]